MIAAAYAYCWAVTVIQGQETLNSIGGTAAFWAMYPEYILLECCHYVYRNDNRVPRYSMLTG
jgi:hypothetical protein